MNLPSFLSFAAAFVLLLLGIAHLMSREKNLEKAFMIPAAFVLAGIETALGFIIRSDTPDEAYPLLRIVLVCTVLLPALGTSFFLVFGRREDQSIHAKRLPWIISAGAVLSAAAFLLPVHVIIEKIHFVENGPFWGMTFSAYGKAAAVYLLLSNVLFLYLFENLFKSATVPGKVVLKYPLLGLLAASFINFIVISRLLVISILDRNFLAVQSCGVIMLGTSFLYSTARYRLFDVKAVPARGAAPSVITIVISGLYLLSLAMISYAALATGIPFDNFVISVLGIFALFLLLAVLISGKAKRRIRRFINENFYPDRYNYRREWRHFAGLMAASSNVDDFLSNIIGSLCETMMVRPGIIWADVKGGKSAHYGATGGVPADEVLHRLLDEFSGDPVILFKKHPFEKSGTEHDIEGQDGRDRSMNWWRAAAALGHGEELRGLIILGPKDMNTPFTDEDKDFLATIADQATLTLENLIMEEKFLESRQIESFNRFASFVVHDLKNTVGMLSLTAENARINFSNVEFQNDAIETVKRSVERMRALINSLNAHKSPTSLTKRETDISILIQEFVNSLKPIAAKKEIALEFDGERGIKAEVDKTAVKRIIENLVFNAMDATPKGGRIDVHAGNSGPQRISISVEDSGIGFDPDYMADDLFRPFKSTKKDGLGIGLVLCKSLAEAHGGTISIGSGDGGGAIVTIELPRSSRGRARKE